MPNAGSCRNGSVTTSGKVNRNAEIAASYRGGETMGVIAARHGISLSRVSYIIRNAGARLSREEWSRRHSDMCRRIARDPKVRAKIAATMRKRWADGLKAGRPRLFADDPVRRDEYLLLRDACGAAYARKAMGLSA